MVGIAYYSVSNLKLGAIEMEYCIFLEYIACDFLLLQA